MIASWLPHQLITLWIPKERYQAVPVMTRCHTTPGETVFKRERGARENEIVLSPCAVAVCSSISLSVFASFLISPFPSLTLFACHINMHPGWMDCNQVAPGSINPRANVCRTCWTTVMRRWTDVFDHSGNICCYVSGMTTFFLRVCQTTARTYQAGVGQIVTYWCQRTVKERTRGHSERRGDARSSRDWAKSNIFNQFFYLRWK